MQQRQLRLGDILDDYCPRERRLTNHAVVAMIGEEVKQTRCTTCDAEHEYKHARVPRQRRKSETPAALYSQVAAGRPKRIPHDQETLESESAGVNGEAQAAATIDDVVAEDLPSIAAPAVDAAPVVENDEETDDDVADPGEEGPVHRPLIRATLPRVEGQPPPPRQNPE